LRRIGLHLQTILNFPCLLAQAELNKRNIVAVIRPTHPRERLQLH